MGRGKSVKPLPKETLKRPQNSYVFQFKQFARTQRVAEEREGNARSGKNAASPRGAVAGAATTVAAGRRRRRVGRGATPGFAQPVCAVRQRQCLRERGLLFAPDAALGPEGRRPAAQGLAVAAAGRLGRGIFDV